MKRKWIIILLAFFILLFVGCFCMRQSTEQHSEAEPEEKMQIGVSFDSFVIERWLRDRDVFVSTARELGAEVNVQNANGDIEVQKEHIDYFIEKGMDAIVIVAVDSYALQEEVEKAMNTGIKVIAYDRMLAEADADLYISFDNSMVGTMMAEVLIENGISGGNVLMLGGTEADSNVPMVEGAFKDIMQTNNVTILDSMHAEGWKAELAATYIYENVDIVAKADAIMCGNDNLASQVVRALAEKRLAGDILVVGQDADLEACQRIVEGTQLMTVYKPVEKLARRAAESVVELIQTGTVSGEDVTTMYDGLYNVPYVGIEPVSVTDKNMNEVIIESGFHLKEDVYLNAPAKMP